MWGVTVKYTKKVGGERLDRAKTLKDAKKKTRKETRQPKKAKRKKRPQQYEPKQWSGKSLTKARRHSS